MPKDNSPIVVLTRFRDKDKLIDGKLKEIEVRKTSRESICIWENTIGRIQFRARLLECWYRLGFATAQGKDKH